jgi:YHS domain-containing protein
MNTRAGLMHRTLVLALLLGIAAAPYVVAGDHETGDVALGGYCPVAYAAMGKAVKGDPKFASEYEGTTYYLANGKAKKMFDKAPQDYVVAYDGWCATGMAHGMKVESDPTVFVVRDGKTYLFSNEEAEAMFTKDAAGVIAKADENWSASAHVNGNPKP